MHKWRFAICQPTIGLILLYYYIILYHYNFVIIRKYLDCDKDIFTLLRCTNTDPFSAYKCKHIFNIILQKSCYKASISVEI